MIDFRPTLEALRAKEFYRMMKKFSIAAIGLLFTAFLAISAFSQVQPSAGKIGLIDMGALLEDKPGAGIPKLKNAVNSLNIEFKKVNDDLTALGNQYQAKVDEYNKLKNSTGVPIGDLDKKANDIQDLETKIKRDQEDAKRKYDQRSQQVVDPIYADIIKALTDYAKQKGYAVILDGAKLEQAGVLLGFDDKYDVTKDFITFYNSRPATAGTTATTAPPVSTKP
jgi:Skp family chaperone for outer membrane proteins